MGSSSDPDRTDVSEGDFLVLVVDPTRGTGLDALRETLGLVPVRWWDSLAVVVTKGAFFPSSCGKGRGAEVEGERERRTDMTRDRGREVWTSVCAARGAQDRRRVQYDRARLLLLRAFPPPPALEPKRKTLNRPSPLPRQNPTSTAVRAPVRRRTTAQARQVVLDGCAAPAQVDGEVLDGPGRGSVWRGEWEEWEGDGRRGRRRGVTACVQGMRRGFVPAPTRRLLDAASLVRREPRAGSQ